MSQIIWDTIIPSTTSGNQLAQLLNDFKDAVVSGLSGTSRPSQLQAGGYWIDTTTTTWVMKIYTGTVDVPIVNINSVTGVASVVSSENLFSITKSSDDTVGPFLELIKKRLAGGGQTLDGDSLGEVSFKGTRDDSVVVKQAGIRAVSTDNVTATAQGSAIVVEAMNDNTATLAEIARFVNGRLGIGQNTPTEKLEVLNGNTKVKNVTDTTVGPKNILTKRRVSGGGQSLANDVLGQMVFQGTQSNGTEVDLIKIEGKAYENTDASAHGAELLISVKNPGTETYFDAIRVVNGQVEIGGVPVDGNLSYQGTWNANTNTPDITASPVKGQYWIVNVAGNTNIDGITDWGLGDWAIYNGTVFQKVDNSDSVVSVNGYQGVVVLGANDIAESTTRYWDVKNFRNATVDPTVSNDSTENYTVGSTWFNTTSDTLFLCKDASAGAAVWVVASGSGGGGLDVFMAENFERLSVADFSKFRDAAYLGTGDTFGGLLSDETASPISGSQSPKYTAGGSSINDWFDVKIVDIDKKQRGEWVGVTAYADMTNFSKDVDFVVYDRTNAKALTKSGLDIFKASQAKSRYSFSVFIPATCTQISFGCHMVNAPVNTESFLIDDIEMSLNPFQYKDLVETAIVRASGNGGTAITNDTTNIDFTEVYDSHNAWNGTQYIVQNSNSVIEFSGHTLFTASLAEAVEVYVNGVKVKRVSNVNSITNKPFNGILDNLTAGDLISFRFTGSGTLSSDVTLHHVTITETWNKEHVITPAKSGFIEEKILGATTSSTGDIASLQFSGLDIGRRYFISGQATMNGLSLWSRLYFSGSASAASPNYGQVSVADNSGDTITTTHNISISFIAETTTLYVYFNAQGGSLLGNGTKLDSSTFIQLHDVDSQLLAAVPVEQMSQIRVHASNSTASVSATTAYKTTPLVSITGDSGFMTISSNQFTLLKGKYEITAPVSANFGTGWVDQLLYNITDASNFEENLQVSLANTGEAVIYPVPVKYIVNISKDTTFEFRTKSAVATGSEYFSTITVRKLR